MRVTFHPGEDHALLRKVSSFLHDAKVLDKSYIHSEKRFVLRLHRIGYEHGYMVSDGFFGFGRRWMYPWVQCELEVSPVASASEEQHSMGTDDFDTLMSLRADQQQLTIHREFSDVTINLIAQSVLRVSDIDAEINPNKGMLLISRAPLDLSYVKELLESGVRPNST